jgi:hypothetical protein
MGDAREALILRKLPTLTKAYIAGRAMTGRIRESTATARFSALLLALFAAIALPWPRLESMACCLIR